MSSTVSLESQCPESAPESILQELSGIIAESQSALLEGKLQELEDCIQRQRVLCEKLESSLRVQGATITAVQPVSAASGHLIRTAMQAREQNRIFSALLRRMRHNMEVMRNILLGPSKDYGTRVPDGVRKA